MKDIKPREFSSREEMEKFEHEREIYNLKWISICNRSHLFQFYKQLLLEAFHPKYRAIKHYYEDYIGGFWRNKNGYACATDINFIDTNKLKDGECCIIRDDEAIYGIYIFKNSKFIKLNLEEAYIDVIEHENRFSSTAT